MDKDFPHLNRNVPRVPTAPENRGYTTAARAQQVPRVPTAWENRGYAAAAWTQQDATSSVNPPNIPEQTSSSGPSESLTNTQEEANTQKATNQAKNMHM